MRGRAKTGSGASRGRRAPRLRLVFALPFAVGILIGVVGTVLLFAASEPRETLFYLLDAPVRLVPVVVYGLAGALLFASPAHRVAWTVLLALGVALTIVNAVYYGHLYMLILPSYLTLVAAVQLMRGGAASATGEGGGR
jgi:hypothetical protein